MKIAALISGGKDSLYAAYLASRKKCRGLVCLIVIKSANPESYMFHVPNIDLVKKQAEVMDIPLIFRETAGKKEAELKDLKSALKEAKEKFSIKKVVSGALASTYQKQRIDKICEELDLKSITPLWQVDSEQYLNELLENKFEVIITAVAAEGLNESFLGKKIDKKMIEELKGLSRKVGLHIAFEGGEAETFVLDCPLFKKKIVVESAQKEMESECCGKYVIEKVKLVDK